MPELRKERYPQRDAVQQLLGEADAAFPRSSHAHVIETTADELPVAFVGSYVPRRCGIATFTRDMAMHTAAASEGASSMVVAMTDPGGEYEYPPEVKYEIRQGVKADYARAAEYVS